VKIEDRYRYDGENESIDVPIAEIFHHQHVVNGKVVINIHNLPLVKDLVFFVPVLVSQP